MLEFISSALGRIDSFSDVNDSDQVGRFEIDVLGLSIVGKGYGDTDNLHRYGLLRAHARKRHISVVRSRWDHNQFHLSLGDSEEDMSMSNQILILISQVTCLHGTGKGGYCRQALCCMRLHEYLTA